VNFGGSDEKRGVRKGLDIGKKKEPVQNLEKREVGGFLLLLKRWAEEQDTRKEGICP